MEDEELKHDATVVGIRRTVEREVLRVTARSSDASTAQTAEEEVRLEIEDALDTGGRRFALKAAILKSLLSKHPAKQARWHPKGWSAVPMTLGQLLSEVSAKLKPSRPVAAAPNADGHVKEFRAAVALPTDPESDMFTTKSRGGHADLLCAAACSTSYPPLVICCARKVGVTPSQRSKVWNSAITMWEWTSESHREAAPPSRAPSGAIRQWIAAEIKAQSGNNADMFVAMDFAEESLALLAGDYGGDALPGIEGISFLVSPLFYVTSTPQSAHMLLRGLFRRLFWRFGCADGMVPIANEFSLLLGASPSGVATELSRLQVDPLALVFRWLALAFSGSLPVGNVLAVWDRAILSDSLGIVPRMAVALLEHFAADITACKTAKAVEAAVGRVPLANITDGEFAAILSRASSMN